MNESTNKFISYTDAAAMFLFIWIFACTSGCNGYSTLTNNTETLDEQQNTPMVLPPVPVQKTVSITPNASTTIAPTASPYPSNMSSLPIRALTQRCLSVENEFPEHFLSAGSIILSDFHEYPRKLMFINSTNIHPEQLDLPGYEGEGKYSPDREWLAYHSEDSLIVLSSQLVIQTSLPWNRQWFAIQDWLDTENLVLTFIERLPVSVDIINPFTGQENRLVPNIDDVFFYSNESPDSLVGVRLWKLVYDPSLTRLAYMRLAEDSPLSLVLMDVENSQILWRLNKFSPGLWHMPVWSPDGTKMIAAASNDAEDNYARFQLFLVAKDGQAIRWVDIHTDLGTPANLSYGVKWSPNQRFIAFYGKNFYVLDTETHELFDYCIPHNTRDESSGHFSEPILWSPDSTQLLVQPDDSPAIIIDIPDEKAVQLLTDFSIRPIGWLKEP